MWTAANLQQEKHCFFGVAGGVSEGIYKGLNVNTKSDDFPERLNANLDRAAARFGLKKENLVLLNQGVSADAVYVTEGSRDCVTADGTVTDKKNVILCIRTADCAPVLLADYAKGIIGAAHAGWRGTVKKIAKKTVDAMQKEYKTKPENLRVGIGPSICEDCFEIGQEVMDAFLAVWPDARERGILKPGRLGHGFANLWEANRQTLLEAGVRNEYIFVSGVCTMCRQDLFFSHRGSGGRRGSNAETV